MYDLNNPSPFVLTHFECIATVSGFFSVALAIVLDVWRERSRLGAVREEGGGAP